jgi:rhamnosyltransferase subunit B
MVPAVRDRYADLTEAVRRPDLLLSAELVFAADSVAEMARIPWVVATLAPLSFMSRYDPPILIQAPWLTRVAAFSKPLYVSLVRLSQWGIRHWTEPVRQMRRDLGLTPGPAGIFGPREKAKAIVAMFSALVGRTGRRMRASPGSPSTIATNPCRRRCRPFSRLAIHRSS